MSKRLIYFIIHKYAFYKSNIFNLFKINLFNSDKSILSKKTLSLAEKYNLNTNYSYFLLHASFGDKWSILSFMDDFLKSRSAVRLLASENDKNLIRIFLDADLLANSTVFLDNSTIEEISSRIVVNSDATNQIISDPYQLVQTDVVNAIGFPRNIIRHLHIVKYPYFSDLHLIHGVSYAVLLKTLLYLPSSAQAKMPFNYTLSDIGLSKELVYQKSFNNSKKIILFNVVNISYKSLSVSQIVYLAELFEREGMQVLINATGYNDKDNLFTKIRQCTKAEILEIPGHLLALVSQEAFAVCGVLGGAMNVAIQFSKSHSLVIYTDPIGFSHSTKTIFGGRYQDNFWRLYDEDWPCLQEGRVVETIDVGDPTKLSNEMLCFMVHEFTSKVWVAS